MDVTHQDLIDIQERYQLSHDEMCQQLGISHSTYYSRLKYGNQKITRTLALLISHMKRAGPLPAQKVSQIWENTRASRLE